MFKLRDPFKTITGLKSGVFIMAALIFSSLAYAQSDKQDFIDARKCHVIERLQTIYDKKTFTQDRFLALSKKNNPSDYVQCLFQDNDTKLLCEVSSGYYAKVGGATVLHSAVYLKTLKRLNFSTDSSKGNFQRMFDINKKSDFIGVSEALLSALFELHGARLDTELVWKAPLAPTGSKTCSPVS